MCTYALEAQVAYIWVLYAQVSMVCNRSTANVNYVTYDRLMDNKLSKEFFFKRLVCFCDARARMI